MTMDMVETFFFAFWHLYHCNELPHSFKQLYNTVYGGLGDQQVGVVTVVGGEDVDLDEVIEGCPVHQKKYLFWP